MPDQNSNQNQPNNTGQTPATSPPQQAAKQASRSSVPSIFPQTDLPPLPPDFQQVSASADKNSMETAKNEGTNDKSANPQNSTNPPNSQVITSGGNKKKFGGGRIIATILGVLLLVGSIGVGVYLSQHQQLFQEKASTPTYGCGIAGETCPQGYTCQNSICVQPASGTPSCYQDCISAGNTPAECGGLPQCNGTPSCYQDCISAGNTPSECGGLPQCRSSGTINCGGVQCNINDCHCQGGDACTSLKCEPDIHQSCDNQGRSWCENVTGLGKTCCTSGYVCNPNGNGCVPQGGGSPPPNNNTPPPGGPSASCQNVKAYSSDYTLLSDSDLANLDAGTTVNFCVTGSASAGSFDKAQFTINTVVEAETTTHRPGSQDFCQSYSILATDTDIHVSAIIHHTTLGWR